MAMVNERDRERKKGWVLNSLGKRDTKKIFKPNKIKNRKENVG